MKLMIFSAILLLSFSVFSHEGHSDVTPKSQHGGTIKKSSNYYVEVVQDEKKWNVYVMDHSYKSVVDKNIQLIAEIKTKNNKLSKVNLVLEKTFFQFSYDLMGERYFKLILKVIKNKKAEELVYSLEPITE